MNLDPALSIIKRFEGLRLKAYQDSVGVWTIGWGTTAGVRPGQTCTVEQADQWLRERVNSDALKVMRLVKVQTSDNMFCALLSFVYNLGVGSLYHSHLLTKLNSGATKWDVANEFLKWDHAGGRVLPGLTRRRQAERELFLS